jgi:membrane protease YdiL (CAAX protease family)
MKVQPTWQKGVIVYLIYNAIIFGTWAAVGADYTNLVGRDVIATSLVLPLFLGAVFLVATITWMGWWRPVMTETRLGRFGWAMWLVIAVMVGFILVNAANANWSAVTGIHLLFLIAAGVLVGFNEEALTRGVLVVGWRGSTSNEVWVWFWAMLLFGLMHLPNGFFGAGFVASSVQVVFAILAGSGFYLIRRISGTLLIPMILHGAWDFASLTHIASEGADSPLKHPFQIGTYLLSIVLVIVVLLSERRRSSMQ